MFAHVTHELSLVPVLMTLGFMFGIYMGLRLLQKI